jgi:serine/threonine-protein kinase
MRLVQGQTLHDLLKSGALEPERVVGIIQQIAAALDAAHRQGLIHRDVKPQNIIVTPDDFAYLVDFGIAEATGDSHLTMTGHQVGTFDYMAPERFSDQAATSSVDVYSLACVLYEALTGDTPFPGHSVEQAIAAHLSSPPPQPSAVDPRVPASLDDVIVRGMAKHPDDRYGSTSALGRAAKRALQANPPVSPSADTMLAPQNLAPQNLAPQNLAPQNIGNFAGDPRFNGPPGYPPTGPTVVVRAEDLRGRSGQWAVPAVIGVAAALVLGAVGVVIGLLANRNSAPSPSPAIAYSSPEATTHQAQPSSPTRPRLSSSTAMPVPQDPEQQMRQIVNSDRPYVSAQLADRWIPQLSSKRPGVVDAGVVWDNAMTLQEYNQLSQRFRGGVSLLWSGDWSTFSANNFWVTVANNTFPDSAGALAWCRNQGFDRDHCIAKIVSTTRPEAGSTAYN